MGEFLVSCLKTPANTVESFEVGDGTINVLAKWGDPKVYFCSHMDTVPPYIPPQLHSDRITGRGSCDAKGQVFAMFEACRRLEAEGRTGFALLVLSGEETGSFGAKAYTRDCQGGEIVIVGEPTDNRMVTASKGTKSFDVRILGKSCHSGYPERGVSAVERFIDFMCRADVALKNFEYITYSTPNIAAQDLIEDEDIKNSKIAFPDLSQYKNLEAYIYLGESGDELYNELWKEVKSE